MMKTLGTDKLTELAQALAAKGWRVAAPLEEGGIVRLKEWTPGAKIVTAGIPVNSLKDFLFPRSEVIGRDALEGNDFKPLDVKPDGTKTVLLCVRPCDAASLAALDTVFNWDTRDDFYNARRAATAVVSLACLSADEQCFCTSVGGRPDSTAGADVLLRPADGGKRLIVEALTEKGRALAAEAEGVFTEAQSAPDAVAEVPRRFEAEAVTQWLPGNFESPLWTEASLPCLGCGACAYACPACHCFDIQDEATRKSSVRYRNWDSCGFGLFTLHASGHNPRSDQSARWRQRVMHKFSYFPQRFKMLSCTGCGRCARLCQAGMSMAEVCAKVGAAK